MPERSHEDENEIRELKTPEFKSTIPGYLADGLTPKDRHVLDALSLIGQKLDYSISIQNEDHEHLRRLNKVVKKHNGLVSSLKSKWALLVVIVGALYPFFSTKILNKLFP